VLLNFGFFVDYMLADGRIILLNLHLFRRVALIFVRRIKVSCSSAGH